MLAALALSIAGLVSPAEAAPGGPGHVPNVPANCNYANAYCGYESSLYSCQDECERTYVFSPGDRGVTYNDSWDSFYNHTPYRVTIFQHRNANGCYGEYATALPNTGWPWLGGIVGGDLLNQVSCVRTH